MQRLARHASFGAVLLIAIATHGAAHADGLFALNVEGAPGAQIVGTISGGGGSDGDGSLVGGPMVTNAAIVERGEVTPLEVLGPSGPPHRHGAAMAPNVAWAIFDLHVHDADNVLLIAHSGQGTPGLKPPFGALFAFLALDPETGDWSAHITSSFSQVDSWLNTPVNPGADPLAQEVWDGDVVLHHECEPIEPDPLNVVTVIWLSPTSYMVITTAADGTVDVLIWDKDPDLERPCFHLATIPVIGGRPPPADVFDAVIQIDIEPIPIPDQDADDDGGNDGPTAGGPPGNVIGGVEQPLPPIPPG